METHIIHGDIWNTWIHIETQIIDEYILRHRVQRWRPMETGGDIGCKWRHMETHGDVWRHVKVQITVGDVWKHRAQMETQKNS